MSPAAAAAAPRRPMRQQRREGRSAGLMALVALALVARGPTAVVAPVQAAEGTAAEADEDEGLTNPFLGQEEAIEEGERIFRTRCTGCHWSPLRAPKLFRTELSDQEFLETVINGRKGARGTMPPFGYVLSPDDVWKVHAFVVSRDRL